MCGICGVMYTERERPVDREAVASMCATLAHRGPDDEGLHVSGNIGLGSRRLSIIDLEGGRQPVHNEDGTIWVVFNGEIYNHPDLISRLKGRGHRFYTRSDTEAIVHAYEEYGDDFLTYLNGMFALALWDAPRQRLVLGRDRLGIKPLYYSLQPGTFLFGSELKALLAFPDMPREIDLKALNEYLSFEYVPTPRSILKGIRKLPPGHALAFAQGRERLWQYWDMDLGRSEGGRTKPRAQYEEELLAALRDAVRTELISDVPVGILLSGGIDSSAVAALAAGMSSGGLRSFSITFGDPSFDESRYARLVADRLGMEHNELELTADAMLDLVPQVADFMDEPLGDSSIIPTYFLSRFAGRQVKVVLGGDGGDELFAGYSTLQAHRLMTYYQRLLPPLLGRRLVPSLVNRLPVSFDNISLDFKAKRFVSGLGQPPVVRHHRWLGSFTPPQKERLLRPWARSNGRDTYQVAHEHLRASRAREPVNQLLYCDLKLYLEGDILFKVDRASMANSLETRVPLLNHRLVDYVSGVPHALKMRGLTTKYILKQALRNLVPEEVLKRGKKGFNMPVAKWLTGPLRPLAEEMFSRERLETQGLFEPAYVRTLMNEHLARKTDHRKLLWTLLMFQLWFERWGK